MISSTFYLLAIVNYNLNNNMLLSTLAFLMQLNWIKICIWLVVACSIKNPSQEDNMGLTYGSRCEHGVHKRRAPDGSTSFNNQKPIFERSGWDVRNMVYLLLWTSSSLWTLTSAICIFENVQPYGRYLRFNLVISCNKDAIKLAHILLPPSEAEASPPERFTLVLVISICIDFGHLRFSILVQRPIFS